MEFPLSYAPRGFEVLKRCRRLYVDRDPGLVMAVMKVPSPTLNRFAADHSAGQCAYPDPQARAEFWDALSKEHIPLLDDSIPNAYPSEMDQGLYGGLLGGRITFLCDPKSGWISSMCAPMLKDWSEFGSLAVAADHEWFRRYLQQLDIFVRAAQGKFGISHFILIDGLNFVFELMGATQTYLDLIERPERIEQAVDFAYHLNLKVQRAFFEKVPLLEGGTCSLGGQWLPGRILNESVDPFHMTSADYFERWGRDPIERIFQHFDGGLLHLHGNGRHLLEAVSTIKGLKAIWLADDKGFPPAFDVLPEIRSRAGTLPLIVNVNHDEFQKALFDHRLLGGVSYQVHQVPDLEIANRTMDLVRDYVG